jgi:hypothetical protein
MIARWTPCCLPVLNRRTIWLSQTARVPGNRSRRRTGTNSPRSHSVRCWRCSGLSTYSRSRSRRAQWALTLSSRNSRRRCSSWLHGRDGCDDRGERSESKEVHFQSCGDWDGPCDCMLGVFNNVVKGILMTLWAKYTCRLCGRDDPLNNYDCDLWSAWLWSFLCFPFHFSFILN